MPIVFQALRFPQRFSWGLWCLGMVLDVSKECGTSNLRTQCPWQMPLATCSSETPGTCEAATHPTRLQS